MHDFHLIAFVEDAGCILFARDDLAVHLDRNTALIQIKTADQAGKGGLVRQRLDLAVDGHAHAATIVTSTHLYNMETIW